MFVEIFLEKGCTSESLTKQTFFVALERNLIKMLPLSVLLKAKLGAMLSS